MVESIVVTTESTVVVVMILVVAAMVTKETAAAAAVVVDVPYQIKLKPLVVQLPLLLPSSVLNMIRSTASSVS